MDQIVILDWERKNFPLPNKFLRRGYSFIESMYLNLTRNVLILPRIKKYLEAGDITIFAADKDTEVWLTGKKIPFFPLYYYMTEEEYAQWEKDSVAFTRQLPQLVPEIDFKLDGFSLWRADELNIHEAFLFPVIYYLQNITKAITQEKAKRIILFDHSSRSGMIQKQFSAEITVVDKTSFISCLKKIIFDGCMPLVMKMLCKKLPKENWKSPKQVNEILFLEGKRGVSCSQDFLERIKERLTIFHEEPIDDARFEQVYPGEYFNTASRNSILQIKRRLKKKLKNLKRIDKWEKRFSYGGIILSPVFYDLLEYLFNVAYPKIAIHRECIGNLLKVNKPKLAIILGECHPHHQVALPAIKKEGILSLFVMHGSFGDFPLYNNLFSDKIAVYGQSYNKILQRLGNKPARRMVVTGNPAWDYLAGKKFDEEKVYSQLNLPRGKKIVLLAATNMPDERDRLAHAVIKTMASLPQYHLVLKLHPEEEIDYYLGLLKRYGVRANIFIESSSLHPLISVSAVVITAYSTVGLESLLLGKPVIDVNLTNRPYYQDYVAEGVALGVRKEEELTKALQSIIEDTRTRKLLEKNRKRYLYKHAYKQDGRAGERVAKLIEKMMKR